MRRDAHQPAAGAGDRVGHYEIVEQLGEGGMGVVYRARDLQLGREVALKCPTGDLTGNPRFRQRFLREGRAAARLSHPNVVQVYEAFEQGGTPWLAMEFVHGQSLRDRLREGPLSCEDALRYAEQLAGALHAAHQQNLLHRDVNPRNIMIDADGRARLLDFGLVRDLVPDDDTTSTITESGAAVGTLPYMSPEQSLGRQLDPRTDVFSLGAVIYEMCTGCAAFAAPTGAGILDSILHRDPPGVVDVNPALPREVERITAAALAKDPADRYSSAAELRDDIHVLRERLRFERYVSEHPEVARRQRHRRTEALAAAVSAALMLVVLGWVALRPRGPRPRPVLNVEPFATLGEHGAEDYVGRELGEQIGRELSRVRGIWVPPAASDVRGDFSLEGDVRQEQGTLRVGYRLVRRDDREVLGSDELRVDTASMSTIPHLVAGAVVNLLARAVDGPLEYTPAQAPTRDPTAYDFFLAGMDYLREYQDPQRLTAAIDVLTTAIERDPSFAAAHAGLGRALWYRYEVGGDVGLVERAREACRAAIALDPELAEAHVCLGTVHRGSGDYEWAVEEFMQAIDIDATGEPAWLGLGLAHQALGNPVLAEDAFQEAIAKHPSYWAGYTHLGAFYYRQGRYAEASRQFEQAIALAPDNARARRSLGGIYIQMGRLDDAVRVLEESWRMHPSFGTASNLGSVHFLRRDLPAAVAAFRQAVECADATYLGWGNLGRAYYWSAGGRTEAEQALRRAIEMGEAELAVNPQKADVHVLLAQYHAMLGEPETALAELLEAVAARPDDPEFLYLGGIVHNYIGNEDSAIDWLRRAVEGGYSTVELRLNPELDNLRGDPRFAALLEARART